MIITILLLPLGHIPFSLPLALESIIVIIHPLNTYGILVLFVCFAGGKLLPLDLTISEPCDLHIILRLHALLIL